MGRDKFSRKGTVALRTLRRPAISDFHSAHTNKAQGIEKVQLDLCKEGGLDGLFHMLANDNVRVQAIAPQIVNALIKTDNGEITLLNDQAWGYLHELCTVKEVEIQRDAVWTAAILAAVPDCHEYLGNAFGWNALLLLAESPDGDVQIATNILIANLAINEETQASLIAVGGLKVLLDQAKKTSDIRLKRAVATAISNAVIEPDNAREFDKQGGVAVLNGFLKENDAELTPIVIATIANIASADEADIKAKVVSEIGLKVLVDSLASSNAQVQQGAAVALGHYAGQEEHQQALYDMGAVKALINLVSSTDKQALGGVAMALSNLSQNSSIGKKMYDDGVASTIEPLTHHSESKADAETAIANINLYAPPPPEPEPEPEPEPVVEEKKEEAAPEPTPAAAPAPVEPTPEPVAEETAQEEKSELQQLEEQVSDFKLEDSQSFDSEPSEATPAKKQEPSVTVSYVAGLLGRMLSNNITDSREAAKELAVLSGPDRNREAVVGGLGSRGLNEIHTMFKTTKDEIMVVCLARIFLGVAQTPIREKVRFNEIAPVITGMLLANPEQQEVALKLVAPLLYRNVTNQAIFLKVNGMDLIINILKTGTTDSLKGLAAKAMHTLVSGNRQAQTILSKKKVLHYISILLESHDVAVQRAAASCVYGASIDNFANQNEFKKAGVIAPLTRLLNSADEGVVQISAGAFFALFHENKKVAEASTGSIPTFITLLRSKSSNVIRNTMAAVSELITHVEKSQDQFCTPDVAASFVNLINSSDYWISYNTLSVVEVLLKKKSNAKRRDVFRDMKVESAVLPISNVANPNGNEKRTKELAQKILTYIREKK